MIWVIHQKAFHGSLMALSKMYSPMLFWLISLCFLETVVISYAFVAHSPEILHTNEENWSMTCMIFGEIILVLYLISMLYMLCHNSENVVNCVKKLKLKMELDILEKNRGFSPLGSMLEQFQGFDAIGYFVVNHSLFTYMTANFATYLVILIQFRISERSI